MSGSRVVRGEGLRWPGVAQRAYKEEGTASFCEVHRRTLLGPAAGDAALAFELRYFEVLAGGFTSLERHQHPHAVVVLAGRGEVRFGTGADRRSEPIAPFDVVYVGPGEPHQFRAADDSHLGILCVVDDDRDRPIPLLDPEP